MISPSGNVMSALRLLSLSLAALGVSVAWTGGAVLRTTRQGRIEIILWLLSAPLSGPMDGEG